MGLRIVADFEELKSLIGQEIGFGNWFEVTQKLIDSFAELTQDPQWILIDLHPFVQVRHHATIWLDRIDPVP